MEWNMDHLKDHLKECHLEVVCGVNVNTTGLFTNRKTPRSSKIRKYIPCFFQHTSQGENSHSQCSPLNELLRSGKLVHVVFGIGGQAQGFHGVHQQLA